MYVPINLSRGSGEEEKWIVRRGGPRRQHGDRAGGTPGRGGLEYRQTSKFYLLLFFLFLKPFKPLHQILRSKCTRVRPDPKFWKKKRKSNGGLSEFFLAFFGIHIIREHEKIIIGAECEDSLGRGGGVGLPLPRG